VSPITGLPFVNFWVNVDHVEITSAGPFFAPNGLLSVNGATALLPATALTRVTMLGDNAFVLGAEGAGQAGLAFTGADNVLDLAGLTGVFHNVGDPGSFASITSVGGLTIHSGAGGMNGVYVPAPGFTGAPQNGGAIMVGGNLGLTIGDGDVRNQSMTVSGIISASGVPFGGAAGGLLASTMTTLGGSQTYDGFNGGLSGTSARPAGSTARSTSRSAPAPGRLSCSAATAT